MKFVIFAASMILTGSIASAKNGMAAKYVDVEMARSLCLIEGKKESKDVKFCIEDKMKNNYRAYRKPDSKTESKSK